MEAEMRKQAEAAAAMQKQLAQLASSNQVVSVERQRLAGQLQVAEVERRHAAEQVVQMQQQVKVEREEKAKLAEGVKTLASHSTQLAQEIRENRPLAPNAIFNGFMSNRVEASINASRSGFFGNEAARQRTTQTILATDGTNTFALCHVDGTPLTLWTPGTDWERLSGALVHNSAKVPIRSLSFYFQDPRVLLVPLSSADAKSLGANIYRISPDPYKFQDAVLVGTQDAYYGECRFEIDTTMPEYLKLDRNLVKGIFGKFNPSRGDLVFSRTGELLGVMANSGYCLMVRNFEPAATFNFSPNVTAQKTGDTLSVLHSRILQMPLRLQ